MIEIKAIKKRDELRQIAYIMIDEQEFSVANVPTELDTSEKILAYLRKRENELKLLLLIKQYPESDHLRFQKEAMTELEAMREWIKKDHKNKIVIGYKDEEETKPIYEYQVIEKQELEYRHPKWVRLQGDLDKAKTVEDLKPIIKEALEG